jgi:hypothetical protein
MALPLGLLEALLLVLVIGVIQYVFFDPECDTRQMRVVKGE